VLTLRHQFDVNMTSQPFSNRLLIGYTHSGPTLLELVNHRYYSRPEALESIACGRQTVRTAVNWLWAVHRPTVGYWWTKRNNSIWCRWETDLRPVSSTDPITCHVVTMYAYDCNTQVRQRNFRARGGDWASDTTRPILQVRKTMNRRWRL